MARTASTFAKFKELQLAGASPLNLGSLAIKAMLVNAATWGLAVTAATNASPAVITTATHGLTTGDKVMIVGALGNTAINGVFGVTVLTSTTFKLYDLDSLAEINGNGAWTSGGRVIKLDVDQFLSDIPVGDRGPISSVLTSKQFTLGKFSAASPVNFAAAAAGTYNVLVYYYDSTVVGTSNLIAAEMGGTGMPITVGSGTPPVNVTLGSYIFAL